MTDTTLTVGARVELAESVYIVESLNGPESPERPVVLRLDEPCKEYREWAWTQFPHLSPASARRAAVLNLLRAAISVSRKWMADRGAKVLGRAVAP